MIVKKNRVKLTIALQTYNRAGNGYLQLMLESILNQSFEDFELLVMDNHSTDSTAELITKCDDPRLTYVRQPPGGSATTNVNRAVWMSRGEYILATHDDDLMTPEMVQTQMRFLRNHPETICVASNVALINESGTIIQDRLYNLEKDRIFSKGEYIACYLKEKLWFHTPTLIFRRDAYLATQPNNVRAVNPAYFPSGDIWSLFMFNLRGPVALLAEPLLKYRQHSGQESRNVHQSGPMLQLMETLIRNKKHYPLIKSLQPAIYATWSKYKAQDILFKFGKSLNIKNLQKRINRINKKWRVDVRETDRCVAEILPFEILRLLLQQHTVGCNLSQVQVANRSAKAYLKWTYLLYQNKTMFSTVNNLKSIAVFGSMLTTFLIVLDATKSGLKVHGIYDSSKARIGDSVLEVPVKSITRLRQELHNYDAIVLSSEREHEAAIRKILYDQLGANQISILSWKDILDAQELDTGKNIPSS